MPRRRPSRLRERHHRCPLRLRRRRRRRGGPRAAAARGPRGWSGPQSGARAPSARSRATPGSSPEPPGARTDCCSPQPAHLRQHQWTWKRRTRRRQRATAFEAPASGLTRGDDRHACQSAARDAARAWRGQRSGPRPGSTGHLGPCLAPTAPGAAAVGGNGAGCDAVDAEDWRVLRAATAVAELGAEAGSGAGAGRTTRPPCHHRSLRPRRSRRPRRRTAGPGRAQRRGQGAGDQRGSLRAGPCPGPGPATRSSARTQRRRACHRRRCRHVPPCLCLSLSVCRT